MGFYLFLLFTVVPLLELALLGLGRRSDCMGCVILLVLVDAAFGAAHPLAGSPRRPPN